MFGVVFLIHANLSIFYWNQRCCCWRCCQNTIQSFNIIFYWNQPSVKLLGSQWLWWYDTFNILLKSTDASVTARPQWFRPTLSTFYWNQPSKISHLRWGISPLATTFNILLKSSQNGGLAIMVSLKKLSIFYWNHQIVGDAVYVLPKMLTFNILLKSSPFGRWTARQCPYTQLSIFYWNHPGAQNGKSAIEEARNFQYSIEIIENTNSSGGNLAVYWLSIFYWNHRGRFTEGIELVKDGFQYSIEIIGLERLVTYPCQ